MKYMGLNEVRETYLSFFEKKQHMRLESFPLVPIQDKSLLLINSGMAPMKNYFLGKEVPPSKRVTTCQKCIRTPDIERVGKTSRHGTFFEMLGNFSFGDYFKREAINWAWEFITKEIELPIDRLYVSVYLDDDEAYDIWTKEIGVDPAHMVCLGKEDNFWEIGSGPCGPCSEIYYDRGEENGCGSPDCAPGCDCDRFVEFWNIVFSQFDNDGEGHYTPMEHPNIDTGMGLERLACIMQGVGNLFEVDTVQNIMKHIARLAGVTYLENEKTDVSLRVVTDHIRSTVFMICDGVLPSNEGRGYVLRRLLRRAARHGKLLGIEGSFLAEVCDTVIHENQNAYPELVQKAEYIKKVIQNEEEIFQRTIDRGLEMLSSMMDKLEGKVLDGADAFKLYDTFGFPIDLTLEIVSERGITVDEEGFAKYMQEQKEKARTARLQQTIEGWKDDVLDAVSVAPAVFEGYTTCSCDAKITALVKGGELSDTAVAEDEVILLLDHTPFYAESGGQVADIGEITFAGGKVEINDVKKNPAGHILHIGFVTEGQIAVGDAGKADVDASRRQAIMRNHTAAHLLQAALREVLGDHVHQAGSLVNEQRMRYDFTHFSAMTAEEIAKVEARVNEVILQGIAIDRYETDIETAKKEGAMALFGEKYGKTVRVCKVGDFSMELCGGTHLANTGHMGLFKIVGESSVASGVRRIEAVTGLGVLEMLQSLENERMQAAAALKLNQPSELVNRCAGLMSEMKEKDKELERLKEKMADGQLDELFGKAVAVAGVRVIAARFEGMRADMVRKLGDKIKEKDAAAVAVLAAVADGKGTLCVCCGADAVASGAHAGKLAGAVAAVTGGRGGGKPDGAMAGIGDMQKIDEALSAAAALVEKLMGGK